METKTCLVCNSLLSFHEGRIGKLCGNPQCQWKYANLPLDQICVACGRPLSLRELGAGVCASPECRQRVDFKERGRMKAEALREEARRVRDQGAAAVGIKEPGLYTLALIPSLAVPVTNLPERRRRAFRDSVTLLISQATVGQGAPRQDANDTPAPRPAPSAEAVMGRACAQCQGHCCAFGGTHAYLTVATIRRYLETHPGLRPRDVLAAYLAFVGNKTYRGSCIYHGLDGCTLPREMRSDICNEHFCAGLREFQEHLPSTGPVRGFFVSAMDDTIRNAAFIDENEVRAVPIPATEAQG